jgi:hypothetical protein
MPKDKSKKYKSKISGLAASHVSKNKASSQEMLGKILPQIKALFIDVICEPHSGAAESSFDDNFSDFIKRFLTKNDVVAWLADPHKRHSHACDKQVEALFLDVYTYLLDIKFDKDSDIGAFLLGYNSFITTLISEQMQDRHYDVFLHVLNLEARDVLQFLQKYTKVSILFAGENGKELGVLMALMMLFENINVFMGSGQPSFPPTVEIQNYMSGFMTKFFGDFEADLETFTRTDISKPQDLSCMLSIMAANSQKMKLYSKQRQQEKILRAEGKKLLEEKEVLTAKLADAAEQVVKPSVNLTFGPSPAYQMREGIEAELLQLRKKLSPSDIDVVIETSRLPVGRVLCAADKLVTQRNIPADITGHSLIEMFYSQTVTASHRQATWVTVFDLFRADIVCLKECVADSEALAISSFEVDRVYLAKPFEVSDKDFAEKFIALKALLASDDVQRLLAVEIAEILRTNDFCARISSQFRQDDFTDSSAKITLKGSVIYWILIDKVILQSNRHEAVVAEIKIDGRNSPTSVASLGAAADPVAPTDNATTRHRMLKIDLFEQMARLSELLKPQKPVTQLFAPGGRTRAHSM